MVQTDFSGIKHFPLSGPHRPRVKFHHQWGKSRVPVLQSLSMMYSCNQRGICSVALLTLLGRKLSRACVYLSLFVLRSPRPCRENTRRRRRYGESRGAAQTNSFDPRYNQTSASRNTRSELRVAAHVALLHSVTCEQPLRGP